MTLGGDEWATPQWLFDELHAKYHFTLDGAANQLNHKLPRWYGPGGEREDSLSAPWPTDERIWFNPPYSRGKQRKFVEHAVDHARRGGFSVGLLPADTSTRLFHELIWKDFIVDFLPRRVRFEGATGSPKFGSMVVEFS